MRRRTFILLTIAVLLTGVLIRLAVHDFFSLDGDDMYSLLVAHNTPADIISGLFELRWDIHPPLHYLALHFWTALTGNSLLSLRAMNLLLDLLTGAALIRLAVRLFGKRGGLIAGLLWTVAPLLIFAGYLTRMYMLMTTFTTLGVWCAVEVNFAHNRRGVWTGFAALFALGAMYTHSIGVLAYAMIGLALLIGSLISRHWRNTVTTLLWFGLAGLLSLPYTALIFNYYRSGKRLGAQFSYYNFSNPLDLPGSVISALVSHRLLDNPLFALLLPLALIVLSILLWRRWRGRIIPLLTMVWFAVAAITLMAGLTHIYKPFYFAAFTPIFLALLAGSLLLIRRRILRTTALLFLLAILASATLHDLDHTLRDDPVAAAQFVADHERPGDFVLVTPDWAAELFKYSYHGNLRVQGAFQGIARDMDLDALLSFVTKDAQGVWIVRAQVPAIDPENLLDQWFSAHAIAGTRLYPTNIPVSYYDLSPQKTTLPDYARPLDARFGNLVALRGVYMPLQQGSARDTRLHPPSNWAQVVLYWEALNPAAIFTPRVRFTDGYGQVFGGEVIADPAATVAKRFPTNTWQPGQVYQIISDLNLNPNTPPGTYNIEVTVLDSTGNTLPASGKDAGATWVIAGHFTIR